MERSSVREVDDGNIKSRLLEEAFNEKKPSYISQEKVSRLRTG